MHYTDGVGTVDPLFGDASDYMLSFTTDSSVDYAVCSNYSDVSSCDFSLSESCSLDSYNLVTCYYSKGIKCCCHCCILCLLFSFCYYCK